MGNAGQANSAAAKAGLIGLTKTTARELASRGITCNAIAPGLIETDLTSDLPEAATEALKDSMARVLGYWHEAIVPRIREGRSLLVVAHGNSLRALSKELDDVSDEAIPDLNIPTGIPLVYEFDEALKPRTHYYLADEERVRQAIEDVAHQTPA